MNVSSFATGYWANCTSKYTKEIALICTTKMSYFSPKLTQSLKMH